MRPVVRQMFVKDTEDRVRELSETFLTETLGPHLLLVEKRIGENASGYLVGKTVSIFFLNIIFKFCLAVNYRARYADSENHNNVLCKRNLIHVIIIKDQCYVVPSSGEKVNYIQALT